MFGALEKDFDIDSFVNKDNESDESDEESEEDEEDEVMEDDDEEEEMEKEEVDQDFRLELMKVLQKQNTLVSVCSLNTHWLDKSIFKWATLLPMLGQ